MRRRITQSLFALSLVGAVAAPASPVFGVAIARMQSVSSTVAQRSDTIVRMADRPRHAGVAQLVEELSIGRTSGAAEYLFARVSSILPLRNGSLLIVDSPSAGRGGGDIFLRQYDAVGRYTRTIGRTGPGPGEFMGVPAVGELPDGSLVLHDQANRLIMYTASGAPARKDSLGRRSSIRSSWMRLPHLTDTAGYVYRMAVAREPQPRENPSGIPSVLVRFRPGGPMMDSVAQPTFPGAPSYDRNLFRQQDSGSVISTAVPFWPEPVQTWSPLGYLITGVPTRYAVDLRIPASHAGVAPGRAPVWQPGDPVVSIRRNVTPVAVNDIERTESRAANENFMRSNDPQWTWQGPPVPTVKPAYREIRTGLDGRIWVHVAQPSERRPPADPVKTLQFREPPVWDVFEPDGAYVGQVRLPDGVAAPVMRGDQVWGVVTNADGVPLVKRWRIAWR